MMPPTLMFFPCEVAGVCLSLHQTIGNDFLKFLAADRTEPSTICSFLFFYTFFIVNEVRIELS